MGGLIFAKWHVQGQENEPEQNAVKFLAREKS